MKRCRRESVLQRFGSMIHADVNDKSWNLALEGNGNGSSGHVG